MEIQIKSTAKYNWSMAFDVLDEYESEKSEMCERATEDSIEEQ